MGVDPYANLYQLFIIYLYEYAGVIIMGVAMDIN